LVRLEELKDRKKKLKIRQFENNIFQESWIFNCLVPLNTKEIHKPKAWDIACPEQIINQIINKQ
jgi:hypothetical protein